MIDTIYLENDIQDFSRSQKIIARIKPKRVIEIKSYQQIFNRKNQSFDLQKEKRSLILAKKHTNFFQKIKTNDSIGRGENYYFSLTLNCPFSCMYCFLSGIYRSANFLVFVNFEDFQKDIAKKIVTSNKKLCVFAGYDTDTLATNHLSFFLDDFYPFFQKFSNTLFEIRTKSNNISSLVDKKPLDNLVIAFSLNPEIVVQKIELQTPSLENRLKAIKKLQDLNFQIGLRFDPIIYFENFEKEYENFFENIFSQIDSSKIHSITLGTIRFPFKFYDNLKNQNSYPKFLSSINGKTKNRISYKNSSQILKFCENEISKYKVKNLFVHL